MTATDIEYTGMLAQAWDLLRGDTSQWPDRFFYRDVIRRWGEPGLDVGCGTGRLLLDYLAQGVDIDGVDNSPEMLALCRGKAAAAGQRPQLYEQPMEDLNLPRQYQTILIPSSSLQLLTDPAAAQRALERLRAHRRPGGCVVASIMTLWKAGDPLESEHERTAVRPEDGATVRRLARSRYNLATECEDTEDVYQLIAGGRVVHEEVHRRAPATRSYTQAQARALFEGAGFGTVTLQSRFTFDPVQPDDDLFTVIAQ